MFSHLDAQNRPAMVNVGDKVVTRRTAHAVAVVSLPPELAALLRNGEIATKKGAIFHTAVLAGVMGAKKTSDLIPLCHPLPLEDCQIEIKPDAGRNKLSPLSFLMVLFAGWVNREQKPHPVLQRGGVIGRDADLTAGGGQIVRAVLLVHAVVH